MTDETIFAAAVALHSDAERKAYLDQVCAGNPQLRAEVEALLQADSRAGSFLDRPALGAAPTIASKPGDTVDDGPRTVSLAFLQPCATPGRLGKVVGKSGEYEVIEVVGQGGMGAVVRAFDTKLSRVVAVKLMAPELAANPMAVKRFLREAQTAAAVHHEHVVTIHAIDDSHSPPFIVMQFVEGQTLQQKLDRQGALELKQILRIGSQMAAGLAAAHKQGLIHRDVKPANILLENGVERVKITDFGLARAADDLEMTQTGLIAGTPQYMSPEQARGEAIDARSDLFSLGSVLYTMCTGRPAFRAETTMGMLKRVCEDAPRPIREVNAEIPLWLEAVVGKLMAKSPADRFQSAAELAELLSQHLAHLQNPAQVARPATIDFSPPATADKDTGQGDRPVGWLMPAIMGIALMPALMLPVYGMLTLIGPVLGDSLPAMLFWMGALCVALIGSSAALARRLQPASRPRVLFGMRALVCSLAYLVLGLVVSSFLSASSEAKLAVTANDPNLVVSLTSQTTGAVWRIEPQGEASVPAGVYKVQVHLMGEQQLEVASLVDGSGRRDFTGTANEDEMLLYLDRREQATLAIRVQSATERLPPAANAPEDSSANILTSSDWQWTEPENLGPAINSPASDGGPSLSDDGLILVFHSQREGGFGEGDLWLATRPTLDAPWTTPENMGAAINSADHECDASLSADGLTLVFQSNRESGQDRADVWIATRPDAASAWTPAVKLLANAGSPALSADGLTLLFNSGQPGSLGKSDLWMRTRSSPTAEWSSSVNLGSQINSPAFQGFAALSSDNLSLVFNSNREGGPWSGPLWISTRPKPQSPWSQPVRLWNDLHGAWSACLSADSQTLLFDSKRPGGQGEFDLWMSRRVPKADSARDASAH